MATREHMIMYAILLVLSIPAAAFVALIVGWPLWLEWLFMAGLSSIYTGVMMFRDEEI